VSERESGLDWRGVQVGVVWRVGGVVVCSGGGLVKGKVGTHLGEEVRITHNYLCLVKAVWAGASGRGVNGRACVNGLSVNEQVGVAIAAHDSLASSSEQQPL
jgi:hypothetical protein